MNRTSLARLGVLDVEESLATAPPQPSDEDMDLDREIEYAFDTEEPMSTRPPAGDIE
jgi:hypothetical protein